MLVAANATSPSSQRRPERGIDSASGNCSDCTRWRKFGFAFGGGGEPADFTAICGSMDRPKATSDVEQARNQRQ